MPPYNEISGVLPLLGTRKKAFNWEHATIQRDIGSFAIVGVGRKNSIWNMPLYKGILGVSPFSE